MWAIVGAALAGEPCADLDFRIRNVGDRQVLQLTEHDAPTCQGTFAVTDNRAPLGVPVTLGPDGRATFEVPTAGTHAYTLVRTCAGPPAREIRACATWPPIVDGAKGVQLGGSDVVILGAYDRASVERGVRRRWTAIQGCRGDLTSLTGTVTIKLRIDPDGSVGSTATKRTTVKNAQVAACVEQQFAQMRFNKPDDIVIVTYPVAFAAP